MATAFLHTPVLPRTSADAAHFFLKRVARPQFGSAQQSIRKQKGTIAGGSMDAWECVTLRWTRPGSRAGLRIIRCR